MPTSLPRLRALLAKTSPVLLGRRLGALERNRKEEVYRRNSHSAADTALRLSASSRVLPLLILCFMGWISANWAANRVVPGADLFTNGPALTIRIEVSKAEMEALRRDPRHYADATITEGGRVYKNVGVHLKGAAGSFRQLDDKPAFTLSFGKLTPGQRFYGLRKIHLNNSVQDGSFMTEILCGELFRSAGVPTTRACHALVQLNDRKLGLFVLKEGFTKDFLGLFFRKTGGNLYDGGFLRDVDQDLELESSGSGDVTNRADLKALRTAANERDLPKRWQRFQETLDVDRFLSFMVLESITWDWDGYVMKANNYRLYHDLDTGKMVFFPHGMDQMFWEPDGPLIPDLNGWVARALLEPSEGKRLYQERYLDVFTNCFHVSDLTNRVEQLARIIKPALATLNPNAPQEYDGQVNRMRDLIVQRASSLTRQLKIPKRSAGAPTETRTLTPTAEGADAPPTNRDISPAPKKTKIEAGQSAPGADLFTNGPVPELRFEVSPANLNSLRRDGRVVVPVTLHEGERSYKDVGLHLKGAAGSFRPVDDKPGLTLNFGHFTPGQTFHGLRKLNLNNSVQDPSYFNEALCNPLFRAAGVPAPRVAHALVELNGRKLGLYVLKEGFSKDFLAQYYEKTGGNFYDIRPGRDVTGDLRKDSGSGPDDQSDLKVLAEAALEPKPAQCWERLQQVLDVDEFLSFMSMEMMCCHWDGYCSSPNNFRLYSDPSSGQFAFFPNDMDQMFRDPNYTIFGAGGGRVAQAIMRCAESRRLLRQRFDELYHKVFHLEVLTNQVAEMAARLQPALASVSPQAVAQWYGLDRLACEQLRARARVIESRLAEQHERARTSDPKPALVQNWKPNIQGNTRLDETHSPDQRSILVIKAVTARPGSGFWRARLNLAEGHYRFEGHVRTTGVVKPVGDRWMGASLRILAPVQASSSQIGGDSDWQRLQCEFDVNADEAEVEFVCDFRNSRGEAWFDLASLRVTWVKE